MTGLAAILCSANVLAFGLGAFVFFRKEDKDPLNLKLLKAAAVISGFACIALVYLEAPHRPIVQVWIGNVLFCLSLALFIGTIATHGKTHLTPAYTADIPNNLVHHGPYKFIRHPFYTSYLITYFASAIVSGHWMAILAFVTMSIFYRHAALSEEEKFRGSPFGAVYEAYRSRTGMFLPAPLKMFRGGGSQ